MRLGVTQPSSLLLHDYHAGADSAAGVHAVCSVSTNSASVGPCVCCRQFHLNKMIKVAGVVTRRTGRLPPAADGQVRLPEVWASAGPLLPEHRDRDPGQQLPPVPGQALLHGAGHASLSTHTHPVTRLGCAWWPSCQLVGTEAALTPGCRSIPGREIVAVLLTMPGKAAGGPRMQGLA